MDRINFLHAFQLDDQCALDQDVDTVTTLQSYSFVFYGQWCFTRVNDSVQFQLATQATLIG
jgi:hypothetical protein